MNFMYSLLTGKFYLIIWSIIYLMWCCYVRLPALLGSFVSICIFFAQCINFHLLMSSLNSLSLSFSFCVFFFFSCSSFVLYCHHVHHIKADISSRRRMIMMMTFIYKRFYFVKLSSAFSRAEKTSQTQSQRCIHLPSPTASVLDQFISWKRQLSHLFLIFPKAFNHIPLICWDLQSIQNVIIKLTCVQLAEQRDWIPKLCWSFQMSNRLCLCRLSRHDNKSIIISSTVCSYERQSRNLGQN